MTRSLISRALYFTTDAAGTVTRRELTALRELIDMRFESIQRALEVAAHEKEKKDAELNDVRHRFVPREVYEAGNAEQVKRNRSMLATIITMGLTIVGLLVKGKFG